MKKIILLTFTFLLIFQVLTAENNYSRNTLYFELLGPGMLYSINYDFRPLNNISLRAGYSNWSLPTFFILIDGWLSVNAFPLTASYLLGSGSNYLDIGGGIVPTNISIEGEDIVFNIEIDGSKTILLGTGIAGYRFQPKKGIFFRIAYTPIFSSGEFISTGGLSLGFSF